MAIGLKIDVNKIVLNKSGCLSENGEFVDAFAIKASNDVYSYVYGHGENDILSVQQSRKDIIACLLNCESTADAMADFFKENGFFINCDKGYEEFLVQPILDAREIITSITLILCELNSDMPDFGVLLKNIRTIMGIRGICLEGKPIALSVNDNTAYSSKYEIIKPKITSVEKLSKLSLVDMNEKEKERLMALGRELCYYYINEGIKAIRFRIDSKTGEKIVNIPNLITAMFYNLYLFDFSKYTYAKCAKPNCKNYFVKKLSRFSIYCCTEHSRSQAQAFYRERRKD